MQWFHLVCSFIFLYVILDVFALFTRYTYPCPTRMGQGSRELLQADLVRFIQSASIPPSVDELQQFIYEFEYADRIPYQC